MILCLKYHALNVKGLEYGITLQKKFHQKYVTSAKAVADNIWEYKMIIIETCPVCGHDLIDLVLVTYPPIPAKQCPRCGWHWEGEQEEVIRIPFGGNMYSLNQAPPSCRGCANHPDNGGSGICHCTLGLSEITC